MAALQGELIDIIRRDRARRSRSARFGKFLGGIIVAYLTATVTALLRGWMLMLAVGVAHAEWVPQLPTIGYGWAVVICALLPFPASSSSKSGDDR